MPTFGEQHPQFIAGLAVIERAIIAGLVKVKVIDPVDRPNFVWNHGRDFPLGHPPSIVILEVCFGGHIRAEATFSREEIEDSCQRLERNDARSKVKRIINMAKGTADNPSREQVEAQRPKARAKIKSGELPDTPAADNGALYNSESGIAACSVCDRGIAPNELRYPVPGAAVLKLGERETAAVHVACHMAWRWEVDELERKRAHGEQPRT